MPGPGIGRKSGAAHWLVVFAALALAGVPCSAATTGGGNIGFLKDAPITRFKGDDLKMFQSNLVDALEQDADGSTRNWTNAKTGSAGEITVLKTFTQDNKRCRHTRIMNHAKGYAEARTDSVFCKEADGRWTILVPPKK
jgi:surface antigen